MAQGNSYVQLPSVVKPYTVYLALHQRPGDPLGDFDWAIVMTKEDESQCVKYQATNTEEQGRVIGEWHIEQTTSRKWTPAISKSLLCMFEIDVCGTSHAMTLQKARIGVRGRAFIAARSVSDLRQGQPFSSKTFALDLLAAITEQAAGTKSQLLESRATMAANWCRNLANDENATMTANWFKIFKMETPLHSLE